jgi:hypothetical protein
MTDKDDITVAVLMALQSNFHGMTRGKLVGAVGFDLGVEIDGKKDLAYLLSVMRDDGLIRADKVAWFITPTRERIRSQMQSRWVFRSLSLFSVSHSVSVLSAPNEKLSPSPLAPSKRAAARSE